MGEFATRLREVVDEARLTAADLHHWFGVPRPTARSWMENDIEPRGPRGDLARERLALLIEAVDGKLGMPPPRNLGALERPRYIQQVRDGLERRGVPAVGAA